MNLLTIKQQQIIAKEKKLLSNVFNLFSDIKVEKQDFELIKDTLIQLEEIFLAVVVSLSFTKSVTYGFSYRFKQI